MGSPSRQWAASRSYGQTPLYEQRWTSAALAPLLASAGLWLVLQLLRYRGYIHYLAGCALGTTCRASRWYIAPYDGLEPTSDGIRYDDVPKEKGYECSRFRGLAATKADEGTSGWSSSDLEQRAFRHLLGSGLAGLLSRQRAANASSALRDVAAASNALREANALRLQAVVSEATVAEISSVELSMDAPAPAGNVASDNVSVESMAESPPPNEESGDGRQAEGFAEDAASENAEGVPPPWWFGKGPAAAPAAPTPAPDDLVYC